MLEIKTNVCILTHTYVKQDVKMIKKKKKICFGKNDIDVYKLMRVHLKQTCAYVNEKGIFKNKFREHTEQHINQGDLFTLRQAST